MNGDERVGILDNQHSLEVGRPLYGDQRWLATSRAFASAARARHIGVNDVVQHHIELKAFGGVVRRDDLHWASMKLRDRMKPTVRVQVFQTADPSSTAVAGLKTFRIFHLRRHLLLRLAENGFLLVIEKRLPDVLRRAHRRCPRS